MIRRYVAPALLLTFVILLAVPALAQSGVQGIGSCTIIDKPGSYVLTRDLTATLADLKRAVPDAWFSGCIVIVADFVSLDLQGHTITGPGDQHTSNHMGIYTTADASGKKSVAARIRNGNVKNFDLGVALEGTGHLVEQMRVFGDVLGIVTLDNSYGIRVKDVTAVANTDTGVHLIGRYGHSVENCQLLSNGVAGLSMYEDRNNPRPLGTRIVGNTVEGNGAYGIYSFCPSLILQNMAYNNGCSEGLGCHDIVLKGLDCNWSDDNNPIQPNRDYPWAP
jgi:hypothetical protein